MSRISNEYIQEFLEKKERKNPFLLKTRYGKSLGERYSVNNNRVSEWLTNKARMNSRPVGKS